LRILSISSGSFKQKDIKQYLNIPKNDKQLFHVLIHIVLVNELLTSVGLNYEEIYNASNHKMQKLFYVKDIGDLRYANAYKTYESPGLKINEFISIDSLANLNLLEDDKIILSLFNGILV